jgi:hypothetical protein
MATAHDIIKRSFRMLKVIEAGEAPQASESQDALTVLNNMIQSWNNERLMLHKMTQESETLTANQGTYTIGTGGDFNTDRPIRFESVFIRDSNNNDYQLQVINDQQYGKITIKSTESNYPRYLYYRPNYPLGQINLWPVPDAAYTLFMNVWSQIGTFAALTTSVSLPDGYQRCLEYNLAVELAPEYQIPSTFALIQQQAIASKSNLKTVNTIEVPVRVSDTSFIGRRGRYYNINSGTVY